MTVLSRHQGPSIPSTSAPTAAQTLVAHLNDQLLPRVNPFLGKLRLEAAERERERGVTQTYGTRAVMPKVDVVETFGLKREELESASHGDMKKDEPEEDLYFIEPSDDLDDALAAAVDGADNMPPPSSPPGAVDTKLISTTGACFCTTIFIVDALTIPA